MDTCRISLGLALVSCLPAFAEESIRLSNVVEGQVLNLEGSSIPDADVYAFAVEARNRATAPRVRASREGQFSLRLDQPGRYIILASQEKEGYAAVFNPAWGVPAVPLPEVQVDANGTRHSVVVRLGPKLGRFIARVVDVDTGQPVPSGHFELQARFDHSALVRQKPYLDGRFELVFPPRLFSLKVISPGYQDWYGTGSKEAPETFIVQLGDRLEMTVPMRSVSTR